MDKSFIAIVDDDADVRAFYTKLLEPTARIVGFSSGPEFLEYLQTNIHAHPDLVITDFSMPNMSGVEMMARAKAMGFEIASILASAHVDKKAAIEAVNNGVCVILEKPVQPADLLDAVDRVLVTQNINKIRAEMILTMKQMQELYGVFRDICMNELDLKEIKDPEAVLDAVSSFSLNEALRAVEARLIDLQTEEASLKSKVSSH